LAAESHPRETANVSSPPCGQCSRPRARQEITLAFRRGARTHACRVGNRADAGFPCASSVEKSLDTARMSACATSFDVIWHDYILTGLSLRPCDVVPRTEPRPQGAVHATLLRAAGLAVKNLASSARVQAAPHPVEGSARTAISSLPPPAAPHVHLPHADLVRHRRKPAQGPTTAKSNRRSNKMRLARNTAAREITSV